jgi:beta-lactamase regulating signal transducer with metallopeptidase domain
MSVWIQPFASWLIEVYLLSTVILVLAALAIRLVRQPARRLAVARSALGSLILLGPLVAGTRLASSQRQPPTAPSATFLESVGNEATLCNCASGAASLPTPPTLAGRPGVDGARRSMIIAVGAFAAGSSAMFGWLGLGAAVSTRLVERSRLAPERLRAILKRIVCEGERTPRLLICSSVAHPVAVGLIRPAIVLPVRFADEEPDDRIEAALAHEWAHIRNDDLWLLAMSRLLLPLLFAHPVYLWLRRQIRADQEALADAAAAACQGPIAYAEALLHWSRAPRRDARLALAPALGLWERSSSLTWRIALVLDREFRVEPSCPRRWRVAVGVFTMALILGLAASSRSAPFNPARAPLAPADSCSTPHRHTVRSSLICPDNAEAPRWDGRCQG